MLATQTTRSRRLLLAPEKTTIRKEVKLNFSGLKQWLSTRKTKLPALIMSGVFLWITIVQLQHYYPLQIQNIVIPGSYLLFLLSCEVFLLYFLSYIFLNTRIALLVSLCCCWLLWLRLHHFTLDLYTVSWSVGITGLLSTISYLQTKQSKL